MMNNGSQMWIILRCAGASTLRLAASLSAAGIEAWTPAETLRKRKGEARRRARDSVPVIPTYVFAKARHLAELLEESKAFKSPHPDFSVFRYFDRIPVIADETLDPLRVAERKRQPLEQVARFSRGDLVKLTEGGFAGMSGVVELSKGQFTLVCFPGFSLPIKISTLLLLPDAANTRVSTVARQAA